MPESHDGFYRIPAHIFRQRRVYLAEYYPGEFEAGALKCLDRKERMINGAEIHARD